MDCLEEKVRWGDVWRERDPFEFLIEKYPGVTRGRLFKMDPKLYARMWKYDRLGCVPLLDEKCKSTL